VYLEKEREFYIMPVQMNVKCTLQVDFAKERLQYVNIIKIFNIGLFLLIYTLTTHMSKRCPEVVERTSRGHKISFGHLDIL